MAIWGTNVRSVNVRNTYVRNKEVRIMGPGRKDNGNDRSR